MQFSGIVAVLVFIPIVIFALNVIPTRFYLAKSVFLFVAGIAFFATVSVPFAIAMLVCAAANITICIFFVRHGTASRLRRALFFAVAMLHLLLLIYFKLNVFKGISPAHVFSGDIPVFTLCYALSAVIFILNSLSFSIAAFSGKMKYPIKIISYFSHYAPFPRLFCGPVALYDNENGAISEEIIRRDKNKLSVDLLYGGAVDFVIGFGKITLLSGNLGALCAFANSIGIRIIGDFSGSVATAWIVFAAFILTVYFALSGFSDMAVGVGKWLGFDFECNFHYPFMSKSIIEFGARWFATFTIWFERYILALLCGKITNSVSCKAKKQCIELAICITIASFYSSSVNAVILGIIYWLLILIEETLLANLLKKSPKFLLILCNTAIVALSFTFLATDSFTDSLALLQTLTGLNTSGSVLYDSETLYLLHNYGFWLAISIIGCTPLMSIIARRAKRVTRVLSPILLGVIFLFSIVSLL